MMNPLLAVVVNFQCLTNVERLIEHALFYWIGPLIVELTLSLSLKIKQKTDWKTENKYYSLRFERPDRKQHNFKERNCYSGLFNK